MNGFSVNDLRKKRCILYFFLLVCLSAYFHYLKFNSLFNTS